MGESTKQYNQTFLDEMGYRYILDAMNESIWIGDEKERTVYANPNFCNLLGYTLEEMIGKESYEFWDEESAKIVKKNNRLRKKGESSKYEGILKGKMGEKIPVLLSGTPIGNGGTAGIMTDLREIRAVREEAEHLQEMNTIKDEFISMVGHELRTPMTGIKGYLSMVLDGDTGLIPVKAAEFIGIALGESDRLIEMVNDMLDVAKLKAGKMEFREEIIEADIICQSVRESLRFLAEDKGVDLLFQPNESVFGKKIYADPSKLQQVLINLTGNAIKFTPSGGRVILSVSADDNYIIYHVRDTGIGIPKEHLSSIFDKFKQVDNYLQKTVNGTGLGLYISKKILSHFHSDLQVTSEIGKGSDFYFQIPRVI